ncbi:hypothetical protein [Geomicrobium sediminis]|uniref:Secreted protein n=1 Tax=Geomicrobium sediminis TaxID=1347788 RepID=A0ABS2PFZ5_9BACL|nr:hypothetical protein [Geomicrobium sediminis]MBM7634021.1 hypothetical protein [Geomicrobium sediminis]
MKIKTWVTIGITYVALVIAGYSVITGENPLQSGDMDHEGHVEQSSQTEGSEDHGAHEDQDITQEDDHMNDHQHQGVESEIQTEVTYDNERIQIDLMDDEGNAPELEVTHEKEMHLIVVSEDLETFIHHHPEKESEGTFYVDTSLDHGRYKAFVDIQPKDKDYVIEANDLVVGDHPTTEEAALTVDTSMTKERSDKTVTLNASGLEVGEEATLAFDLHGEEPQPYLGALGHVVILDEAAENFIHVHPVSENETVFETHFAEPGLYKVWVEFDFSDQDVVAFPFVIEVQS